MAHLILHTPMPERATTMTELAGVLGHEIAYIARRHSGQQMQQAQGASVGMAL